MEYLTVWDLNKGESDTAYAQFRPQDFSPDLAVCDSLCVGKKPQIVGKSERTPADEGWHVWIVQWRSQWTCQQCDGVL